MVAFPAALLQCSVSMSLVTLVYAAILPLLSKRYTAKWRYMIWVVIAVGWVFPFRPRIELAFLPEQAADTPLLSAQLAPMRATMGDTAQTATVAGETAAASTPVSLWMIAIGIWIAGVIFMTAYHALRHKRFIKIVGRWEESVTDLKRLGIFDSLKSEMEIKAHVRLSVCQSITSPMLVGFFRPVILLPPGKIDDDALSFILQHELIHLRRHDLWYKALILAATVLHWFNPVVYLMAKAAAVQCEISCDELVLRDAAFPQRKRYGEIIIGIAGTGTKLRTALSTDFYGGRQDMKKRISSIMDTSQKKAGFVILCVALVAVMAVGVTPTPANAAGANVNNPENIDTKHLTLEDFREAKRVDEIIGEPGWWDTRLFILAELPEEDITLYGMKEEDGTYGNVAIRSGETINYYGWSYYAGSHDTVMSYLDYDGDGVKELAVLLYYGNGTGFSVDQLFMLEETGPGVFEDIQFKSEDYIAQVEKIVSYRIDEKNKTISLFKGKTELRSGDISRLKENEKIKSVYYGDIVGFDLSHGIVMNIAPGMQINDRGPLEYAEFSELEATVEYQSDGTFHVTDIR